MTSSSHSHSTQHTSLPTMPPPSSTSSPPPPSTLSISPDQYNALLLRLDAEVLARTQLEADLAASRDQIAYLQRRLSAQHAQQHHLHHHPSSIGAPPPSQKPPTQPMPAPACQPSVPSDTNKEILSHCSDISFADPNVALSNCHTTTHNNNTNHNNIHTTSPPSVKPVSSSVRRRSPVSVAAPAAPVPITKKSKAKKERVPKLKIPGQSRYWTPEEHQLFLEALNKFGHKDLRSISCFVGTRNTTQVRTHSQKYFMRLMREAKRQNVSPTDEEEHSSLCTDNDGVAECKPVVLKEKEKEKDRGVNVGRGDKYSVPDTCGMTLLSLVCQDTHMHGERETVKK